MSIQLPPTCVHATLLPTLQSPQLLLLLFGKNTFETPGYVHQILHGLRITKLRIGGILGTTGWVTLRHPPPQQFLYVFGWSMPTTHNSHIVLIWTSSFGGYLSTATSLSLTNQGYAPARTEHYHNYWTDCNLYHAISFLYYYYYLVRFT